MDCITDSNENYLQLLVISWGVNRLYHGKVTHANELKSDLSPKAIFIGLNKQFSW